VHTCRMFAPILAAALLLQQGPPDFGGAVQIEKMKVLSFLVGEWKGSGYYQAGERKIEIECTEKVESVAGGTCLMVIGKHFMKGPNDQRLLIHDAAGMIRYSPVENKYRFMSQLANGLGNDFDLVPGDKSFVWGLESPTAGASRYSMKLTSKGEWNEIGERSSDGGKTWTKFLEMTLAKK